VTINYKDPNNSEDNYKEFSCSAQHSDEVFFYGDKDCEDPIIFTTCFGDLCNDDFVGGATLQIMIL